MHNSGHGLVLGHVYDMRCRRKAHVPAYYGKNPESEIPQRYLSRRQTFIDNVRKHLGR